MRTYQILGFFFFLSFSFLTEKSHATTAIFIEKSLEKKSISPPQDSVVITAADAAKAFKNAERFYNNTFLYIALTFFVSFVGGLISLIFLSSAQKDWEKAYTYYSAVGNEGKMAALKKMTKSENALLVVSLISLFISIISLVLIVQIFAAILGGTFLFASFLSTSLGMGIFFLFFVLEKLLFKTRIK